MRSPSFLLRGTVALALFGLLPTAWLVAMWRSTPPEGVLPVLALLGLLAAFTVLLEAAPTEPTPDGTLHVAALAWLLLPSTAWGVAAAALGVGTAVGAVITVLLAASRATPLGAARWHTLLTPWRVVVLYAGMVVLGLAIGLEPPLAPWDATSVLSVALVLLAGFVLQHVLAFWTLFVVGHPASLPLADNQWPGLLRQALILPLVLVAATPPVRTQPLLLTLVLAAIAAWVLGGAAYNRLARRLRHQLDEVRALSVFAYAMREGMRLDALLNLVYLQVVQLLQTQHVVVALAEPDSDALTFPLVMVNGQRTSATDALAPTEIDLIHFMLREGTPLLLDQEAQWASAPPDAASANRPPLTSWLGVPLLAGGRALGVLVTFSRGAERRLDAGDLRLLNIVAGNVAVAVDNVRLYERQTERAAQFATLNSVASLLTSTLSPDEVLEGIVMSGALLMDARAVAVFLRSDDQPPMLMLARSAGFSVAFTRDTPPPTLATRLETPITPPETSPPLVVGTQSGMAGERLRARLAAEGLVQWVEVPLPLGGQLLGVVLLAFDSARTLDNETHELLRNFASQAAQAVNNARLYSLADRQLEERVAQLFALAAVGRQMTASNDLQAICDLVLGYAVDIVRAQRGAILLTHDGRNNRALWLISHRGYPPAVVNNPHRFTRGAGGQALREGVLIYVPDMAAKPQLERLTPYTRTQLVVPILRDHDNLGLLTLEHDDPDAFTQELAYFVVQLVNQATIAIENYHLFQTTRAARDRLQVLLDAMTDAIVLLGANGVVTLANPAVAQLGLAPGALVGTPLERLLANAELNLPTRLGFPNADALRALVNEVDATPYDWQPPPAASYGLQAERNTRYIRREMIAIRAQDGGIEGVLLVFHDETEKRELDQTREDLSRMVVHDLRSPLTAVTTSLRLMRDLVPTDSPVRPSIERTAEAGTRALRKLLARVDLLLDVSKVEAGQMTLDTDYTPLRPVVDTVLTELAPLADERRVQLINDVPPDLPLLDVDADKLERVLQNLVDNALKYTATASTIRVVAAPQDGTGRVRIDVADRGPGIPADYRVRLFDRYVQVAGQRGSRRGTGLGLTFCRMVVEAHGGSIWVEDNPGGGSVFAFTLPAAAVN